MNRRKFIETSALTLAGAVVSRGTAPTQAPKLLSSYNSQANRLRARMTLEEKIGQMVQAEQSALKDFSDIERYFLGSVLSGGSSDPKSGNSLENWTNLYDSLQLLFGDYKPKGKLSHSWPRSMDQIPTNVGDRIYDPLFSYGFGLSY